MSSTEQLQSLAHDDYPGLFQAADAASVQQQRSYLATVRFRLVLTVAAAACGAASLPVGAADIDLLALGAAVAFVGVMAVELVEATSRRDRSWYASRALAESIKTLSWRYVSGAEPFTTSSEHADREFVERLSTLQRDMPDVPMPSSAPTITDKMRAMRAAPLAERQQAYLAGRVIDQQDWYANKALRHQRQAGIFRTAMVVMEVVGIGGALITALTSIDIDMAGIVAAGVSAFAAWNSTRQNDTTATAYMQASHELNLIRERLDRDLDEQQWSDAVVDAETAISREHTMWHAHRST